MKQLPTASPCEMGVNPAAVLKLLDQVEKEGLGLHSLVLVRHGHIVAQGWRKPFGPGFRHMLFSLTKSFTSTAVGFAAQEGLLQLSDKVVSFFPDVLPARPCPNMEAMEVRHLLMMATGHEKEEPAIQGDFIRNFLTSYVELAPGSHFLYNSAASCMLAAIVEKLAGCSLEEYLTPRLFEPLGIEDRLWEKAPQGICYGGFGLNLRTVDIAKFGQFLLQKGSWDGKQLLDARWVEQATSFQIQQPAATPDWQSGYGYQFWRCSREEAYRGDGAFGQLCVVLPKYDMVIAVNAGLGDMQQELDVIFEALIPGLSQEALARDEDLEAQLEQRLRNWEMPLVQGRTSSPAAAGISGKTYRLAPAVMGVSAIGFDFSAEPELALYMEQNCLRCKIGFGEWREAAENGLPPKVLDKSSLPGPVACVGAWQDDATLELLVQPVTTPVEARMTISFTGNALRMRFRQSASLLGQIDMTVLGVEEG